MKRACQLPCIIHDGLFRFFRKAPCRIDGYAVTGMNACPFNMLHDTGNQNILSVADGVHLHFLSLQIFIHQDRMVLSDLIDDSHKYIHIMVIDCDLHSLPAQHIGRPYQNRISETVRRLSGFFRRIHSLSFWPWDLTRFQNLIKKLPVFCGIHILRSSPKNRHSHFSQCFCQFDRRLSAELDHCPVRLLHCNNVFHVFRSQRFKIQFVCDVEVRTDRFRIVVNDNRLISFFFKCPCTVYGTEVKLNPLSDADGAGTQNQDFFPAFCLLDFVLTAEDRIVIGGSGFKFRRTGIYHPVNRPDAVFFSQASDLHFRTTGQPCNHTVRKFKTFCFL